MTPETLLSELETLTHMGRIRRMVALGRQSATDPDAAELRKALETSGGFYESLMVLYSCFGEGAGDHGEVVMRALDNSSRILRNMAAKLVPLACTDEQVRRALEGAPRKTRLSLLRGLMQHRRGDVIAAYLRTLPAGDGEHSGIRAGELLAYAPESFVKERLPEFVPLFGYQDWLRLVRRQPRIAFDALRARAQAATGPDPELVRTVNIILPELAASHPDLAMELVRALLVHESLPILELQRLAERRPNEFATLLLENSEGGTGRLNLSRVAYKFSPNSFVELLRRFPHLFGQPLLFLRHLSPEIRRAAFEIAGLGWRTQEGVLDSQIVALLPSDLREREARRCLALPALATRPNSRLPYATFLPWDEARAVLESSLNSPDAGLRGAALSAIIGTARYQARLPDAIALVRSRANEQDPVRLAMLAALAALPPSRWQEESLDDLGEILQAALDASDLSPSTAGEAEKLVITLMAFHPAWAASWMAKLAKSRGYVSIPALENRFTDSDIARIAPELLPVLESWATQERSTYLVRIAASFGRRLRVFDGLAAILERLAFTAITHYVAAQALSVLAEHRPEQFAAIVPDLLQRDPSAITLPSVHDHLNRKRQDLLSPYLGRQAYKGRFGTGRTVFVLPIMQGFERWLPEQQEEFAGTLSRVIRDEERNTPAIFQAIRQLAALPAVYPATLIAEADRRATRPVVRDAALRALPHIDSGAGVPVLVDALGDSRARIAIYALRSALLEMPGARALALLKTVPTNKLTVAKEVLRLIGELETPDTFPYLLAQSQIPLHRDVRVALLRALWDFIERDETWPILQRAAADPDPAIAGGVIRIPVDRLSATAQGRLLRLYASLLAHPEPEVRIEVLRWLSVLSLADREQVLLAPLTACLQSALPDEMGTAAQAIIGFYTATSRTQGKDSDLTAITGIMAAVSGNRRAQAALVGALQTGLNGTRARLVPAVHVALKALATDPMTATARVNLALDALPGDSAAAFFVALAASGELHPEALMAGVTRIAQIGTGRSIFRAALLSFTGAVPDDGRDSFLYQLRAALGDHADERLRRLALAAVISEASGTAGWTAELRDRLEGFRRDPSPLVAATAQFTFPPPEEL